MSKNTEAIARADAGAAATAAPRRIPLNLLYTHVTPLLKRGKRGIQCAI